MFTNIFKILGLVCVAVVVAISLYMHWLVNKKAGQAAESVGNFVVRSSVVRMILVILAAVFLVASELI